MKPAVDEVFPRGDCLFQWGKAKMHRTQNVMDKVDQLFKTNLWSILKSGVAKKQPAKDVKSLKLIIKNEWREVDKDKLLLMRMIHSITMRVEAMLTVGGAQVLKDEDG